MLVEVCGVLPSPPVWQCSQAGMDVNRLRCRVAVEGEPLVLY